MITAVGALGARRRAEQFLREVKPDVARVAVLGDPRVNDLQFGATEAAASRTIADGAVKHRLAAICPFVPQFAEAGGLLAYGPDFPDLFRRAGDYVARILKGTRVGDLPVQRPEKFVLAVNVKTARVLGLTLPITLVQRAARVIE